MSELVSKIVFTYLLLDLAWLVALTHTYTCTRTHTHRKVGTTKATCVRSSTKLLSYRYSYRYRYRYSYRYRYRVADTIIVTVTDSLRLYVLIYRHGLIS